MPGSPRASIAAAIRPSTVCTGTTMAMNASVTTRDVANERSLSTDRLIAAGVLKQGDAEAMTANYVNSLENNVVVSRPLAKVIDNPFAINFEPFRGTQWRMPANTALSAERIRRLGERFTTVPEGFTTHRAVARVIADLRKQGVNIIPGTEGTGFDVRYPELNAYTQEITSIISTGH